MDVSPPRAHSAPLHPRYGDSCCTICPSYVYVLIKTIMRCAEVEIYESARAARLQTCSMGSVVLVIVLQSKNRSLDDHTVLNKEEDGPISPEEVKREVVRRQMSTKLKFFVLAHESVTLSRGRAPSSPSPTPPSRRMAPTHSRGAESGFTDGSLCKSVCGARFQSLCLHACA